MASSNQSAVEGVPPDCEDGQRRTGANRVRDFSIGLLIAISATQLGEQFKLREDIEELRRALRDYVEQTLATDPQDRSRLQKMSAFEN